MTSGETITTIDVSTSATSVILHFDYRSQKLYSQYWDNIKQLEYFVNIDYLGSKTVRKIATVNLQTKMVSTRALDYYQSIFYLIADNNDLIGLNTSTGNEILLFFERP
jgi:hypothetical protein